MSDKRELILSWARDDEEKVFLGQMMDLCQRISRSGIPELTNLLHPGQRMLLQQVVETWGLLQLKSWGGYPLAERQRSAIIPVECKWFDNNYELSVVSIQCPPIGKPLGHRDYLGALLGLGLKRHVIGDILVHNRQAWVVIAAHLGCFVANNLTFVGRTSVSASLVGEEELTQVPSPIYETMSITVASQRLDAVVAKIYHIARGEAQSIIRQGKVKVNYRLEDSVAATLKEGDLISCRGRGRFKVWGERGITRSGRVRMDVGRTI